MLLGEIRRRVRDVGGPDGLTDPSCAVDVQVGTPPSRLSLVWCRDVQGQDTTPTWVESPDVNGVWIGRILSGGSTTNDEGGGMYINPAFRLPGISLLPPGMGDLLAQRENVRLSAAGADTGRTDSPSEPFMASQSG